MRKKVTIMLAIMASMLFASLNQTIVGTSLPHIVTVLGGMETLTGCSPSLCRHPVLPPFWWVNCRISTVARSLSWYRIGNLYGGIFLVWNRRQHDSVDHLPGNPGLGRGDDHVHRLHRCRGHVFPRERGRWQGLMSSVFGLSSVLGPTLGGYAWITSTGIGCFSRFSACRFSRFLPDPPLIPQCGDRRKKTDRLLRIAVSDLHHDPDVARFFLGRGDLPGPPLRFWVCLQSPSPP